MSELSNYILCLGSNTPDKAERILRVADRLGELCTILRSSGIYEAPDESGLGESYVNIVLEVSCQLDHEELKEKLRKLETDFGRTAKSKSTGVMPLDADIIICNSIVLDRYQFGRDYFKKGYQIISK